MNNRARRHILRAQGLLGFGTLTNFSPQVMSHIEENLNRSNIAKLAMAKNGLSSTYNAKNLKLNTVKDLLQNGELLKNILLHKKLILEVVDFHPAAFQYIPIGHQLDFAKEIFQNLNRKLADLPWEQKSSERALANKKVAEMVASISKQGIIGHPEIIQWWQNSIVFELLLPNNIYEENMDRGTRGWIWITRTILTYLSDKYHSKALSILPHNESKCILRISYMCVPDVDDEERVTMRYDKNTQVCDNIRLRYFRIVGCDIAEALSMRVKRGNCIKGYEGNVEAVSSSDTATEDDLLSKLNSIKYALPGAYHEDPTLMCIDCKCDKGFDDAFVKKEVE